ncbi:MAG: hypothetical protein P4L39_11735 [Humidesulfovibrio sp.]|nr:hypothetical protein [Humidesulfovibrio sp.]
MLSLALYALAVIALLLSNWKDPARTRQGVRLGLRSLMNLAPNLLGMVALVGLVLALLPPELLSDLFRHSGLAGFALVAAVGSLVTMPAPVAFPLAGSLLKLGVSLPSLAAFITTLTMVGVVTAPMETAHFGKRFTMIRQSLSFLLAITIGALMGVTL